MGPKSVEALEQVLNDVPGLRVCVWGCLGGRRDRAVLWGLRRRLRVKATAGTEQREGTRTRNERQQEGREGDQGREQVRGPLSGR